MTLLLLHGLGQSKDAWQQTLRSLHYEDAECPDLLPADKKNQTFSSLMEHLESRYSGHDDAFMICGVSLGAILAMEFYFRHPQKVKALILVAPQYRMPAYLLDIQNIIFRFMPKNVFQASGTTKENMISISASMRHLDYRNRIESIRCPVSIVCGEKDKANRKAAVSLNRLLPNSTLNIVPDAGHEVNTDAPEHLAEIIRDVMKATDVLI